MEPFPANDSASRFGEQAFAPRAISSLAGRAVAVYFVGNSQQGPHPAYIEVTDVAGDQDGPAAEVILESGNLSTNAPRVIALSTKNIDRLLAEPAVDPIEITVDEAGKVLAVRQD
jgi:hypothetical protein